MRKLLSGLAIAALIAGVAEAKPGNGNGNGNKPGGGNPHASAQGGGPGKSAGKKPDKPGKFSVERAAKPQKGADRKFEQAERRAERKFEQAERKADRKADRKFEQAERKAERALAKSARDNMVRRIGGDAIASRRLSGRGRGTIDGCPPGLAKKNNGCMPPGLAKKANANRGAFAATAGAGLLASALTPNWLGYDDYGPDYRYYDGYLLRTRGDSVLGYVPLLGGALAPGRPWVSTWQPDPIPVYYTDYYGLSSIDRYRYYDDVIYELDPGYSEIEEIVAIMTGDPWAIGQPMPYGYDVYNVPWSYRDRYYDSPDHWYRYSDGYMYDIDPTTRLVLAVVQLLT